MKTRSQVTLPASIVKQLHLKIGDQFEIELDGDRIVLKPVITIPRDQAYFWTKEWQEKEKIADEELKQGNLKGFDTVNELIADLEK